MKSQGIATPAPAAASKSPRHFGDRIALAAEGMTLRSGSAEGRTEAMGQVLPVVGRGVSGGLGDFLLERDRQLELIGGCLGRARQGRGGALMVEGPAGIGKTVLLAAARDAARARGFRLLRARGAELEQGFAFGVVRQLFESAGAGEA